MICVFRLLLYHGCFNVGLSFKLSTALNFKHPCFDFWGDILKIKESKLTFLKLHKTIFIFLFCLRSWIKTFLMISILYFPFCRNITFYICFIACCFVVLFLQFVWRFGVLLYYAAQWRMSLTLCVIVRSV